MKKPSKLEICTPFFKKFLIDDNFFRDFRDSSKLFIYHLPDHADDRETVKLQWRIVQDLPRNPGPVHMQIHFLGQRFENLEIYLRMTLEQIGD